MRVVLFHLCCLLSIVVVAQQSPDPARDSTSATRNLLRASVHSSATRSDTVTVIGVGDIMMGTSYPEDRLPPDNGRFLLRAVAPVLRDADVTFGNLEGTLLDEGGTPKKCNDPKVCYAFRSPVRYVENLLDAGFD